MARLKHTDPELFTTGEVAHGTGLAVRNMQSVRDTGLMISGMSNADGKNSASVVQIDGLMQFAMVAGLNQSGLGLIYAAKMAIALRDQFNDFTLGYMSGLSRNNWQNVGDPHIGSDFWFWMHHELRRTSLADYAVGDPMDNDIVLVIADRRYAFLDILQRHSGIGRMGFGSIVVPAGPDPFCEISDHPEVNKDLITQVFERPDWEWTEPAAQQKIWDEYQDALRRSVGQTRVNLSLAIRNVLDRIYDLRMAKGGKIFAGIAMTD